MKLLAPFLTKLYRYITVFIVVASPLFFIPGTFFSPDITYYITMMVVVPIALTAYLGSAFLTKSWHRVSKLEFISYFVFAIVVLISIVFARNPYGALFGEALNPLSGASLLALPVMVYLVRTLPENLRLRLKYVLAIVLSVSVVLLTISFMTDATTLTTIKKTLSGFSVASSLSAYIGIFIVGCFFFIKKALLPIKHKIVIAVTALVFLSWVVGIANQDKIRPDFTSSMVVSKEVLVHDGIFGVGTGDYMRAWQLYRPSSVIESPYFGYDFGQGSSTMTTFLTTIGVVGLIAFLMLVLSGLYSTYKTYRATKGGEDHIVTGFLTLILLYLALISWVVPLSYAMLVVWMVVSGFGFAKAKLTEYHPHKKLAWVMVPLAVILIIHAGMLLERTRAFLVFSQAQNILSTSGPANAVGTQMDQAIAIYPYDGFYRSKVEYIISAQRVLLSIKGEDQQALKNAFLQKTQTAVDAGLAAVALDKSDYQNYVSLGRAYELVIVVDKQGGFDRAKKAYEEAVVLYPNNPYLYLMLARLEVSAGTKEQVRKDLMLALSKKSNFADAQYMMSQLEASENNLDSALSYALEAVKNAPSDPLTYTQAGLLFYNKKDYQNAVTAFKAGLEKDQNNTTLAYFLALSLRDGGRPDLALPIAQELSKRNPTNTDVSTLLRSLTEKQPTVATTTVPVTKTKK
jgi:tetratricopeptide (TPR) repeat protein